MKMKTEIDAEILERLENYGRTVISETTFLAYGSDERRVEEFLRSKGFKNCKCWMSMTPVPSITNDGKYDVSVLIEGKRK